MQAKPPRPPLVDLDDVLILGGYLTCALVLCSIAWQASALFLGGTAIYLGWRRRRG